MPDYYPPEIEPVELHDYPGLRWPKPGGVCVLCGCRVIWREFQGATGKMIYAKCPECAQEWRALDNPGDDDG